MLYRRRPAKIFDLFDHGSALSVHGGLQTVETAAYRRALVRATRGVSLLQLPGSSPCNQGGQFDATGGVNLDAIEHQLRDQLNRALFVRALRA